MASTVRIGIIGVGNMGSIHAKYMHNVPGAKLAALADRDPERLKLIHSQVNKPEDVACFDDGLSLIAKGNVDAVIIATPHYDHPPLTIAAFKKGLHVLTEKPVAVTAKAADEVNETYKKMRNKPIWGAMFQQRTDPIWKKVKQLIDTGEIGEIRRVNWIITNWFRTQSYYNSGGWRATWSGEGGGVLINQCPHNLDLIQWFVGMPNRVTATVGLGKHHDIEVEDDVTAILEYPNGATGVFITSTGDSPGTNRLEITGDCGRIITGGGKLELLKTHQSVKEFCYTCEASFANVTSDKMDITVGGKSNGHQEVTEKFVQAILKKDKSLLVAEAIEGIHGLELGNAMLMSGLSGKPIDIPTPRAQFDKMLKDLAAKSKFNKPKVVKKSKVDMASSF